MDANAGRCRVHRVWRGATADCHAEGVFRHACGPLVGQGERAAPAQVSRSEEHTSELQSLMRTSYAVFCLKKKTIPARQTKRLNTVLGLPRLRPHKQQHVTPQPISNLT